VIEYVVQTGPLKTFDALFDNRFDKLKHVADFHTIQITGKPVTQRIVINRMRRSSERELNFVSAFFAAVSSGQKSVFVMRDVGNARGIELVRKLGNQKTLRLAGEPPLKYSHLQYGASEDDLLLVALGNFNSDFSFLHGCVPPAEGVMAFYLTNGPFDLFDIHFQRACRDSLKAKDDRIRRDVLSLAHEAQITLFMDADGAFSVTLHPKVTDVEAVEERITAAGASAGMKITFAPGLFS
jgi:hypothetical protein